MKEFGQDGTTAGIWNGAEFLIRRTAWIGGVKLSPVLEKTQSTPSGGDGSFDAKLFITLQLHAIAPGRYSVTAQAGGSQISSQWNLAVGESTVVLVLPMRRPRLWWTWDLGESFAYRCDLLREAHINGVRVCVHVNRNEFYDALDRAGIVTWQDFPLSARSESRR